MSIVFAGRLRGDAAVDLAVSGALGGMASVYPLDVYTCGGGICCSLPEWLAPGVAKGPAHLFDHFLFLRHFGGGCVVAWFSGGGGLFDCGVGPSDGRELKATRFCNCLQFRPFCRYHKFKFFK